MKKFLKSLYVRIFRMFTVLKFKKFGKGSFIGSHAKVKGGKHIKINQNVRIGNNCRLQCFTEFAGEKLQPEIIINDGCYIGDYFTVLSADKVIFEKDVLIASNVTVCSENHSTDPVSIVPYKDQPLVAKPVTVGEGAWIGQNVVITPGVKIGKKCVIGAAAVVTQDVEDYTMVAGVPAKLIKQFDFSSNKWVKINK